ncbi:MAG: hypothetical protein JSV06_11185 [Myxococcales bacterium]|nr:MAG: hypothetical protein JSV06_11185 [Myxococcales bacterium]
MAEAGRKLSLAAWVWVLIAALAAFELVAHPLILAAIPSDESWEEASAFVRARFGPSDVLVAAPAWADPIVRYELGDLTSLRMAAPVNLAGVGRVWELAIRGATTRDDPPLLEEDFGGVRVRMWPMDSPALLYDFVEEIEHADVELVVDGERRACPWTQARPDRGGLGRGPMMPTERFICDPRRPWLWVGATVLADLDLRPRRCIWQHPAGTAPVRVTFSDVPVGERLVVHAGVDYGVERRRAHAPVTLAVWIDAELAGELVHHDGDGWSRLEIDTSGHGAQRATVRFETTAPDPAARLFCYSASAQTASNDG